MEKTKTEQTPAGTHTTINQASPQPSGGNGTMWFLLGGVVVVVAIIAYFVLGNGTVSSVTTAEPAGGNVSVNVDTSDAPAADVAPAETAPAETAPAAD